MLKKRFSQPVLKSLQQSFMANLTASEVDPAFLGWVETNNFSIYRHNRRTALLKALANIYPVCRKIMGEQYFQEIAKIYLEQYPSYSANLNDYGAHLSGVLAHSSFIVEWPYLIDLARLEWQLHCIFIGADEPFFDWQTLATISSVQHTDLIFHRPVNSALIYSSFPIDRIWKSKQVDLTEREVYLFVKRLAFDIHIAPITALQFTILEAIDGRRSLETLRIVLSQKIKEEVIIENLPVLIKAGYITRFSL